MPRWLRVLRGMLGTGLAFAVASPIVIGLIGLVFWIMGEAPLIGVAAVAARSSVLGFGMGFVFSGAVALLARGRTFEKLSLAAFTALGGGVGLAVWTAMGVNGAFGRWSLDTAIANLVLLTAAGAGSAAATLLVARRAKGSLSAGDALDSLGEGPASTIDTQQKAGQREDRHS